MREWFAELKMTRIVDEKIFLCHGTPQRDNEYLIEDLHYGYVVVKKEEHLLSYIRHITQEVIICGHSHIPRLIEIDNKIIINPGSVGLPAYSDDKPVPHRMENFSPRARYCVLDLNAVYKIEHIALNYDFESAARQAEKNYRPDWAKWLRTGKA
jgi:predicted phosphodiesterase